METLVAASWPELPYAVGKDTCSTLQLWTQIIGKVRLSLTPWINHSWHVTLRVTARGLGTLAALRAHIAELERRLGLNSSNSGKPPSSDGLKKPARVSVRQETGRAEGSQRRDPATGH